jgi:hypothetical protein
VRNLIGYRAGIALVVALVTTFTRPDTAALGLTLFGGYALALAIGTSLVATIWLKPRAKMVFLPQALLCLVAGVVALASLSAGESFQLATLQSLLLVYLAITAAIEGYLSYRVRANRLEATEHLIAAGLALAISVILALIESQPLNILGFFGAYLAITAVHLGIWAASPKKAN